MGEDDIFSVIICDGVKAVWVEEWRVEMGKGEQRIASTPTTCFCVGEDSTDHTVYTLDRVGLFPNI